MSILGEVISHEYIATYILIEWDIGQMHKGIIVQLWIRTTVPPQECTLCKMGIYQPGNKENNLADWSSW